MASHRSKIVERKALRDHIFGFIGKGCRWATDQEFLKDLGMSRSGVYRFLHRSAFGKEDKFLEPLARTLKDTKSKLMWLAGYNPLVEEEYGLNSKELYYLWEFVSRVAKIMRNGHFHGTSADFKNISLDGIIHCSHVRSNRIVKGCKQCDEMQEASQ